MGLKYQVYQGISLKFNPYKLCCNYKNAEAVAPGAVRGHSITTWTRFCRKFDSGEGIFCFTLGKEIHEITFFLRPK